MSWVLGTAVGPVIVQNGHVKKQRKAGHCGPASLVRLRLNGQIHPSSVPRSGPHQGLKDIRKGQLRKGRNARGIVRMFRVVPGQKRKDGQAMAARNLQAQGAFTQHPVAEACIPTRPARCASLPSELQAAGVMP